MHRNTSQRSPRSPAPRPRSAQPAPLAAALLPGVVSAGSARLPARSSSSSGSSRSLPSPPPGRGGCRIPEPTPRYSDIHRAASRPGPRSAAGPPLFSSSLLSPPSVPRRALGAALCRRAGKAARAAASALTCHFPPAPLRAQPGPAPAEPPRGPALQRPLPVGPRAASRPAAPGRRSLRAAGRHFAPLGRRGSEGRGFLGGLESPLFDRLCLCLCLPCAPELPRAYPAELFGCTALLLRSFPLK